MPASAVCNRAEELVERLSSIDSNARLKALRDVKNQIIGNKTRKLNYIKLGAVPRVVEILANESDTSLLVQSAATVGSFACGVDAGVQAVVDSGGLPHLLRTLSNPDSKVVEAGTRSLRMILQSKLAPKYGILQGHSMELLLSLLSTENENVAEVLANVIARCCQTNEEQQALCDAGALQMLVGLLGCSLNAREASLEALAALTKNSRQISLALICIDHGGVLAVLIKLVKDKSPRTRLLACMCLANISHTCPSNYPHEWDLKTGMLSIIVKLLDEPGCVGEDAPYALAELVENSEKMQNRANDINAIEKLCSFLHKNSLQAKHLQGILLALAELCSCLEDNRRQVLNLKAQGPVATALGHESIGVRVAACVCIKSLSRSVKNIRTSLTDERLISSLFNLLNDPSPAVQVAALSAISNVVLDFAPHRTLFFKCGGMSRLIQIARSMDPLLRLNAVWALRNLLYLEDILVKEKVMMELTLPALASLIQDTEEVVQEQALAFVRNIVYGSVESVQQVFAEDGLIFHTVVRQLSIATRPEVCTQGLYVLSNIAAGSEYHKEEVIRSVAPNVEGGYMPHTFKRFLQDTENPQVRVAAVWCITNLSYPDSPGVATRIARLKDAGIIFQIQKMVDDPCLDVKDRVKTTLEQFLVAGNLS